MAAVTTGSSVTIDPWQPASEASQALGWSLALFGFPGVGKTTFSAVPKSLIVDFEGGTEVIADRDDVMVWPRRGKDGKLPKITWDDFMALDRRLRTGNHPFEVIAFDTASAAQRLTLAKAMKASATPQMPSQPEYGVSNALLADVIEAWCALSRETGITVVFNIHAQEVTEESGSILIRMALTPGVTRTIHQSVSSIGYLEEVRSGVPPNVKIDRKLTLRSTNKVQAKLRQPLSGPQLPGEMTNPSLVKILEFRKTAREERSRA